MRAAMRCFQCPCSHLRNCRPLQAHHALSVQAGHSALHRPVGYRRIALDPSSRHRFCFTGALPPPASIQRPLFTNQVLSHRRSFSEMKPTEPLPTSPPDPVLIIGAGLAGLSLAQALKSKGIPFHIFERDDSASFRAQGYRIRIYPEGARGLKQLLPEDLWEVFQASCAEVIPGGRQYDALTAAETKWAAPNTRPKPSSPSVNPAPQQGSNTVESRSYNADRAVLRSVLMRSLESSVSFGKRFEKFSCNADGAPVAHFADGSSMSGRLLVGADGVGSLVRRQMLPGFLLMDTEGRAVFGKTLLTPDILDRVPSIDGLTLVGEGATSSMKLIADKMVFDRSKHSSSIDLPPDYIYWVLVFRLDSLQTSQQHSLHRLSPSEAATKSIELSSTWHPSLRALLADQEPHAASILTLLSANPDRLGSHATWSHGRDAATVGRVTILGDAAHPMPPVGGVGANTAFEDAADLFHAIASPAGLTPAAVLAFERKMQARAFLAVSRSAGGAQRFFGMRPVDQLRPATWVM